MGGRVKRGLRFVRGGPEHSNSVALVEKLGRNDLCPCGSGKRFQEMLHALGPVSTAPGGTIIGGETSRSSGTAAAASRRWRGMWRRGAYGLALSSKLLGWY
jgi:hypothetical protein